MLAEQLDIDLFKMIELAPEDSVMSVGELDKETPPKSTLSSRGSETDKSIKRQADWPLINEEPPKKKLKTAETPPTKQSSTANQGASKSLAHLLSWKDSVQTKKTPPIDSFKLVQVSSIVHSSLDDFGQNMQAILIDASWRGSGSSYIEEFKKLKLSDSLINNGIVFVWAEKEDMSEVMAHLQSMNFVYVEIFSFILLSAQKILQSESNKSKEKPKTKNLLDFFQKKDIKKQQPKPVPNKNLFELPSTQMPQVEPASAICAQNSDFFRKGKKNLIMMRKINKKQTLQLRHQRTSDVYFVLYDQKLNKIDQNSYQCIYKMIETLLIKANYQAGQPLKMMQLWARSASPRAGWVSVSQLQH